MPPRGCSHSSSAEPFFGALRALEPQLGRMPPRERWGPRRIDLDLLLFDAASGSRPPELQLPHPGIVQRNFVLYPLLEVAPELTVPGCGRVAELAARVDPSGHLASGQRIQNAWRLRLCRTASS